MSIVTFYSYKGGVGRSMALANIAVELAKRNKKVLIVDWDLEAPGLEKYFSNYSINTIGNGLLALLLEVDKGVIPRYVDYLWSIKIDSVTNISFLHSGREKDPVNFSRNLEKFDWISFFRKKGGVYLENLRSNWLKDFDLVLIDSRTGLSDSSGICTILMPDIIIPFFTANHQSLYGVRDIMRYAQNARHKLEVERMALTILPVPTRFGTRVEFKESQEWLDRFASTLKEFYNDWLPKWIEPKHVLEQIKIPQIDYFSFGEKLAVAEQGTTDPESMGYIYAKIAALLASDFEDIPSFIGKEFYNLMKEEYEKNKSQRTQGVIGEDYEYDVFISHAHSNLSNAWINEFGTVFLGFLTEELGYSPKIFIDQQEISFTTTWSEFITNSLKKTKCALLLLSPDYLNLNYSIFELEMFLEKERQTGKSLIVPALIKPLDNEIFPDYLGRREIFDFGDFNIDEIKKSSRQQLRFTQKIESLAHRISIIIKGEQYSDIENFSAEKKGADQNTVVLLAKEYEDLRKNMRSSNERTRLMQYVFEKMKNNFEIIKPILNNLIESKSAGERLFAIAALHTEPNLEFLKWLSTHVGNVEKSFIGYQASVAIYLAAKKFGKENKDLLLRHIDNALRNILLSNYSDPNQVKVLETAKTELSFV